MPSTHRSPKGKGRAGAGAEDGDGDGDYAQSFASLSLSDYGDHPAPRNDSYDPDPSCTDAYGSFYTSAAQGPQSLIEASLAAHEAVAIDDSPWLDTPSASSIVTEASSAPSAHSNRTDVNTSITRQRPPNERYQLPCEFHNLTGCDRVFSGDELQNWMDHIEDHLQSKFPTKLRCWFCSEHHFDARETSEGDVRSNFNMRMHHIRHHIIYEGYRPEQMQKDGHLIQYLIDRNLIDRRTYESIVNPMTVPPIPGDPSRRRSHRSLHSYRILPQVEEKVVPMSSGRHHHRSKRSWLNLHRIKTGQRNREGHSMLNSTPSTDSSAESVFRIRRQDQTSLSSSSIMLENTPLEGLRSSSGDTAIRPSASKHIGDQSIAHGGDETGTKLVMNELQKLNTAHVKNKSSDSPGRVESPQSEDHSHVGPPSYSTDASTLESGSFWLAEYPEEEENRLDEDHLLIQFRGLAVATVFETFHSWKGDHSEENLPCDGVGESDPASKQDKGKGKASATGKRTWADQSESSKTISGSSGPSSNRVGCSKRRRTSDRQLTFACPYTKKDPMSYRDCYKYKLSRIRDVKQHLARCHRNPPYCARCMGTFETEEERDEHIRESSCPLRPSIRLDGITESQKSQLAKKSAANASPEAQWFAVFDIVFPGHEPRPLSPYVDSELLQDITHYQDFLTSYGPRIISEVLAQRGVVTWHLPNEEQDLAAFQQTVFEDGLGIIFEQWLARRSSSSSQDSTVLSGSGISSQNNPPSSSNSSEMVGPNAVHDSRAVPPVTVGNPTEGGPGDAVPAGENVPANSADHFSLGEGSDGAFGFEHGGVGFPAGSTNDFDEVMRLIMDDAQSSSEFPPDLG